MANIVWDLVDPAELTQYIRAYDNEVLRDDARIALDQILPNQDIDDLDFRVRRGALTDVDAAEYRAFDTPARMTGRPGTTRIQGELGPVSRQIPLGEEEALRQRALDRGVDDPIIDAIYADAERMVRSVQVRVELARGDVIDDGVITINEGGFNLTADWGRAAGMSVSAGTDWDDAANGTPITDLLTWSDAYYDQNGIEPAFFRVTREILGWLKLSQEVRDFAGPAFHSAPERVSLSLLTDVLAAQELPLPWMYQSKFRVDGVQTDVLNADKTYLLPPTSEPVGNTFYGPTAEGIKLAERGLIERQDVPGIVALATQNEHPVQTFTVATALALPVMPNPDLIMDATIDS